MVILSYLAFSQSNSGLNIDLHAISNLSDDIKDAGVIGFSIRDSIVPADMNDSNLCSLWNIHSFDNDTTTSFCQGSAKCCNFIDLKYYYEGWNNDVYLFEGIYGATRNGSVSAKIIYVDYSLDSKNLYSDIRYSDEASLHFILPEPKISISELLAYLKDNPSDCYSSLLKLHAPFIFNHDESIGEVWKDIGMDKIAELKMDCYNVTFNSTIKDSAGNDVEATVEFYDMTGGLKGRVVFENEVSVKGKLASIQKVKEVNSVILEKRKHKVVIKPFNHVIKDITISDLVTDDNITEFIRFEELDVSGDKDLQRFIQAYAIDPTAMNFTKANVTVIATGTTLYKCKDWVFEDQRCYGEWELFKTGLIPGQEYTFELTPDDPAFGEVNESIYYLFNAADVQYAAYKQMKNESVGITGYTSATISLNALGPICFSEKWLAPNWTTQTRVNGTWSFSVFGDCTASNANANLFAKILKYNGTEYNPVNTTFASSDICAAAAFNNWGSDIPYSDALNLSSGERIGVQFCLNVTSTANKVAYIQWENTESSYIKFPSASQVADSTEPSITIYINDTDVEHNIESVLIDFNASDASLDSVIANVTYPNGTLLQQLTDPVTDFIFIPANLTLLGRYNITVFANDTSGNSNSSTDFFYVNDTSAPIINISVNDTDVEYGTGSVLIDFNVSNVDLDTVLANVTYPNGTLLHQLTDPAIDFIFIPTNLTVLGRYNITVFANDTGGNTNTTADFFYVNDTTPPTWDQALLNQVANDNESFSYDVNATDLYQIDKYFINDTVNFAIDSGTGIITNATSLTPKVLYLNISVNDTSDNIRSTIISITIQDSVDPVLTITYPVNGSTYYTLNLTLNWTYTEDYPDKCWYNLNDNPSNDSIPDCTDLYANFTALSFAWNNITMWMNDTSSNMDEKNITFYARQQTSPNVTAVVITPKYNGIYVSTLNDMHCNYTYNDAESDSDQSTIKWFKNDIITTFTNPTIPYQNTSLGEQWICEVLPYDGLNYSAPLNSSYAEIGSERTNITVSNNATIYTGPAPNNQYTIWAYYTDEDDNAILAASCSIAGNPDTTLSDGDNDGNYTYTSQWSSVGDKIHTFTCSKTDYQTQNGISRKVTVINHPTNLIGHQNVTDIGIDQYVNFTINYTDANTSALLATADCDLNISGVGYYNMTETASNTYEAIIQFTEPGEFTPEFICSKEYYQDANLTLDIINVTDTIYPSVNISINDTDVKHSVGSILIDFNASDQFLDSVIANVTYPNGTLLHQLTNQLIDFIFGPDNLTDIGRYNITVFANDTSNNINNTAAFFYVNDTTNPTISISVNGTDIEYGIGSVLIDFNASDSFLDSVIANVTYPNGTLLQQLTDPATDFIFIPANLTSTGRYNVTVFTNDTTGNTNATESFFYVNDTTNPAISISVNDTDVEYSIESILIDFNASDSSLDSVIANVTYPNGTLLQQLTDPATDFEFTPTNLTALGRYNITVFANDTSGNINTTASFFYVNDTIDPVTSIFVNDTDVEYATGSILIDFNASDSLLDSVIANVTYPNGTLLHQLTDPAIDFEFTPSNLTVLGRYNITVFANDTSGNTNTSASFFYVNDTLAPTISITVNDSDIEYGQQSVSIDFNASDPLLDSVIANVTYPNGTLLQQLTNQATDFIFTQDNLTALGRYNITIFANDTSGNTNTTISYFNVNDTIAPSISISVNDTDVEFNIESVLIDFNASNGLLDSVIANVTYPNGTLLQQLTDPATDFIFTPANLTMLGRYNITVFANDTSGNTNTTASYFNVNDTIAPTITIYVNDTNVQNGTESVLIDFNASDSLLDSVIANVTYPNGTILHQLTNSATDFIFTPSNLTVVGRYNITVFANDTTGNTNTSTSYFQVVTGPKIDIYVNDTDVEYGTGSVLVDFNVTSSGSLDIVVVNVTYPNGTLLEQQTNQSIDFIFGPTDLTALGKYDILIFANDSDGNPNTESLFFYVNDTTSPTWDQTPQNQITEYNNTFSYDVNASDYYQIDKYFINDTANFAINSGSGVITNATALDPGILYLNVSVNDTSGNIKSTIISITVQDSIDPVLTITYPVNGSTYYTLDLTLNWTFTEDYPDKCWYNLNHNPSNISIPDCNDLYTDFTALSLTWNNITAWINDTSNNIVADSITFYARTQTSPTVSDVSINPVYSGANVSTLNDMHCNYTYSDAESDPDQSTIRWFKDNIITTFTDTTIQYQNTSIGEEWICEVTPYDGLDYSSPTNSSAVEINVEPTTLIVSDNATVYAGPPPDNNYMIWAYYADEENNTILDASCFILGSPASFLSDTPVVDGNYSKNFNWTTLGDKTHTFNCSEADYQTMDGISRTVTVINHPTTLIGQENTSSIELGDSVLISANYTDDDTNISLSSADCDVDIPGMGTYDMTETNISIYEVTILFNQTGEYSPEIICSKEYYTGGNVFINTINTSDTTPPDITIISPENGTYNANITFSFNVSDQYNNLSDCLVYLNSTFNVSNQTSVINHEINQINLTDRQDESFLWHIECTDLNNNTGSSESRSISIDNLDPTVALSSPLNATDTSDNSIDFTCSATDNMVNLSNITLYHNISGSFIPNETESVSGISNSSTFSLMAIIDGTYIWNCLVYDSLGNSAFADDNYTITIDANSPTISISINDSTIEYGIESIKIDFNASDLNLDSVIANVTYPNGTLLQQLTNQATDFIFNQSNLTALGRYDITVFANDTFGNSDIAESFFNVVDTTYPTWNQTPSNQSIGYNTSFNYDVNASDNNQIDRYFIDDISNFIINADSGIIANNTLLDLGIYSLNISVNDTSSNIESEIISITVHDSISPIWDQILENQDIEAGTAFSHDVNASDNYQIDEYFINDTGNFAINPSTGVIVNNTVLEPSIYYLNISVNDTSGNTNSSQINITVNDTINPAWEQMPTNQTIEYGTAFSYDVNASDYLLDKYSIDDDINFTINSASGLITNNTLLDVITYPLNISVNDTSNNINSSIINITIQDLTPPTIDVYINDTTLLLGVESVIIDFNASDHFLDSVIASISYPNATLLQQLTDQSESFIFNPDNLTALGDYNVSVFANDTSGNSNTAITLFTVTTDIVALGQAPARRITYELTIKDREPIYIPVRVLPPVREDLPERLPVEERPTEELVGITPEKPTIAIPVQREPVMIPLGFMYLELALLFSAFAFFMFRKKK